MAGAADSCFVCTSQRLLRPWALVRTATCIRRVLHPVLTGRFATIWTMQRAVKLDDDYGMKWPFQNTAAFTEPKCAHAKWNLCTTQIYEVRVHLRTPTTCAFAHVVDVRNPPLGVGVEGVEPTGCSAGPGCPENNQKAQIQPSSTF